MNWTAAAVFVPLVAVVAGVGVAAGRWGGRTLASVEEWGLGGRRFGTVVTWFLIGGDAYTAYTLLAVPGMVYGVGASGFFALAYTVLAYPAFFVLMPRLWETAKRRGYVTLADFTQGEHGSAGLGAAVAFTGILATVPYIALQLLGIEVAIAALGAGGNLEALVAAFALLALWDYWGGLRAPASVAFIKDSMVFAFVIAAVVWIPTRLGGYGHIFSAAGEALARRSPVGFLVPQPGQYLGFATLTLGSALAILLYPHVTTSVLSASSSRVIRRNAVYLPAYNLVLGLIALMGYMALAAGVQVASSNDAVPALLLRMMPGWFAGFCLAAIAIGGLVPAAVMAIAASSLFVRSLLRPLLRGGLSGTQETAVTKLVSLGLKLAALGFVVWGRPSYMINFQLLGGVWILQTLPAVVLGLYRVRVRPLAMIAGWGAGMATGTAMVSAQGMAVLYPLRVGGGVWTGYAAVYALVVNLALVAVLALLLPAATGSAAAEAAAAKAAEPAAS